MRQAEGPRQGLQTVGWALGQTHLCPGVRTSAGGAAAGGLRRDAGHSRGVCRPLPRPSVFLRFEVKSGGNCWVLPGSTQVERGLAKEKLAAGSFK